MKYRHSVVIAGLMVAGFVGSAISAGMFQTLPQVASLAFCASTVSGVGLPAGQYGYPGGPPNTAPGGGYAVVPGSTQGSSSGLCGETVPAGPPILTGNEIFPADVSTVTTSPTFQGTPTTVAVPIILTDSGAYQYSVPNATRANFTLVNPLNALILDGSGALTQVNIQLPGTAVQPALNGQQVHIASAQSITTLGVVGGTGTSVSQAPTVLTVTTSGDYGYTFIYDATTSTWYRYQ